MPSPPVPSDRQLHDRRPAPIEVRGVSVVLGGRRLLRDVDLDAAAGEVIALVGPNGAGKTTLLRVLAGILEPSAGTVRLAGESPAQRPAGSVGAVIGEPQPFPWMTPQSFAHMVSDTLGLPAGRERTERALDLVGLDPALRRRRFRRLSAGQRATGLLASALLGPPEVLLLDEPFTHLDDAACERLVRAIAGLRAAGATVVYSCHHRGDLVAADRAVGLVDGRVAARGAPDDLDVRELVR